MEEANGYHDELIDVGEIFGVWIIEGPAGLEDKLPFKKAGLNVHVVEECYSIQEEKSSYPERCSYRFRSWCLPVWTGHRS